MKIFDGLIEALLKTFSLLPRIKNNTKFDIVIQLKMPGTWKINFNRLWTSSG